MSLVLALGAGGPRGHVADWSSRLLDEAAIRGHQLIVVDRPDNLASVDTAHPAVHALLAADFADYDAVEAVVGKSGLAPVAVVAFREYSLLPAARYAAAHGLRWNSVESILTTRTKDLAREVLRGAGLPQPWVEVVRDEGDALQFLRDVREEVVVKPRDAFGSQGVRLVSPGGVELVDVVREAFRYSEAILIEEFVSGREFSVEGVFLNGAPAILGVTEKCTTPPPFFVELAHEQPARITEAEQLRISSTVTRAVTAVGLTYSHFHVEVWVTDTGEVVCGEIHSRVGGDWIHALTARRRPGIELFGMVLDDLFGITSVIPAATSEHAMTVIVARDQLRLLDDIDDDPGVDIIAQDINPVSEESGVLLRDSFARQGMLVVAGGGGAVRTFADRFLQPTPRS